MKLAKFFRKAANLQELKDWTKKYEGKARYKIEKIIELTDEEYENFTNDFLADSEIVKDNRKLMHIEHGTWHCILVKPKGRNEGILTECEGYDYPRYTAYLENIEE